MATAPPLPPPNEREGLIACYARRSSMTGSSAAARPAALEIAPIGRGTAEHLAATTPAAPPQAAAPRTHGRRHRPPVDGIKQRLIAAGLSVALLFAAYPLGAHAQQRYLVQPGDTLESVAAEFGVDPQAVLRASWVANPPYLNPGEVVVIPDPGQSPEDAAVMAAEREGTSPWTVGAYWVQEGDTIEGVAALYGVAPADLLALNGLTWDDTIYPRDRLLIPGGAVDVDTSVARAVAATASEVPYADAAVWVPTYKQERSLSCEYAAVFIATSAIGAGIPESAFMDAIPVTANPHEGFRGDIDGVWGGYDDYGIYPEPLLPVLADYGFAGDAFYSDGNRTDLTSRLDAGQPVVVWLAFWGDTGRVYTDDGRYTVFAGDHVVTAYGYDDQYVYVSDPASATYRAITWDAFLWMWGIMDGMALAISPA